VSQERGRSVFITGGARSGKSSFALREASSSGESKAYIATAEALDAEMRERIELHKKERGGDWYTIEEPLGIEDVLEDSIKRYDAIVIDCLTIWVSNLLHKQVDVLKKVSRLAEILKDRKGSSCNVYLVSNEVGMGIVPMNKLSRRFRDTAGKMNQMIAAAADEVYLVASGIPVRIK